MYEYITNDIPFVLARSIWDDDLLIDTEMDFIQAQSQYAEILKGTERLLMLYLLQFIGVSRMTPAETKMVCVDINYAVVTKLSNRGFVESVGIVTRRR